MSDNKSSSRSKKSSTETESSVTFSGGSVPATSSNGHSVDTVRSTDIFAVNSKRSSKKSCTKTESESSLATSSGASITTDAGQAVGVSADCAFVGAIADHNTISCDQSTQSTVQQSIQDSVLTTAGQAVGANANCALIGAIAEGDYDDSGDESGAVQKLVSPDGLCWDAEEPRRGGVNDDSASLEVSAITPARSAYTLSHPVTMDKLRFSSLGLHGRKNEIEVLRGCFDRFVTKLEELEESESSFYESDNSCDRSCEVVFISGESGTGKTALAESIKERVASCEGTYITGKFDLKIRGPYFGIISLFRELCGEILELRRINSDRYQELCRSIISEVGGEIVLLTNIVPVLEEAIEVPFMPDVVADQGNKEAKERLKYAFLQFFRVITRYFHHLVIVLDDLQWTDALSIELLEMIINNRDISIMFIGIYRSNEVDEAHYLSKTIRDMHDAKKKRWDLTEVSIGNLDAIICEEILVQLLCVEPSTETSRLAGICHKRTAGNAFHLLAYLSMLQEQKLLVNLGSYNNQPKRWTWDPDQIEGETTISSNVVELIKATISKQPQKLKDLLQLVSCLGTSFERDIVICAFPHMHDGTDPSQVGKVVDELLSLAVRKAFLERQGDSRYRWVHDSIQAAAMQQVSEADTVVYKFKLGMELIQSLEEKDVESNLLDIVNLLLHSDEECSEEDRATLLSLCLKAAKKSTELTSFDSCVIYAERGISLLPVEKWTQEREVSLELYSLLTEAYLSLVNAEKMKVYADEVLQQSSLSELEKVRVHICNISLYAGVMNKAREALDMSIDVLRKLGCKFPKNKLLQVRLAVSSVVGAKLPTEKDIADLPIMDDPTRKACMEIMVNAATFSHHCNNIPAFIMINSLMTQWTMKYGVDVYSAPAFALFGMVKKATSYKTSALYADRGFQLLDMCKEGKRTESRVTYISWFQIYPFSKPIHSTLKHLLRGYKVGMETGDVESAMWSVSQYMCNSIVAGKALKPLAVDCMTYIEQMQMLKADFTYHMSLPFAQGVLNMIGDAEDPLKLSGSAMVEEDFLAMIESSGGQFWSSLHLQIFKSMMCSFFGDFEQGAKLALERGDVYEKKNGSPLAMTDTLHQGVSFYAMARRTKEKRYIKAAKKVKKKVATWVKKGNVNAVHYLSFFEAEEAALEGKSDSATKLYPKAIISAASSGFLNDAALVSERFAEYLLYDLKDSDRAGQYFQESIKYYTEWGSDYKADLLKQRYSHLWEEEIPKGISVSPDFVADAGNNDIQDVSDPSAAAHAVGANNRRVLIAAIAQDESGDESKAVGKTSAATSKACAENSKFNALGFGGNDEPGRGGANEDSASMDISAITTPYTKVRARPLPGLSADDDNGVDKVEEGDVSESGTTEVDVMDDKTDEVAISSDGKRSAGTSALIASRDLLLEGYRTELDNGDVESVAFQISLRWYQSWSTYHPLVDLQAELEASISALVQLNQRSHERSLQAYLLVVRRLRNLTSEDETSLGFKELLKAVEPTSNVFHTVNMMQLELFVLFQDWESALPCLAEAPDTRNRYLAMHASARGMFLEALVYLKTSSHASSWLARRKRKMKAIKTLRKLHGLVEQGNDDVRHYMHILMAECYVLEKNVSAAENNFKAAISIAELGGFLHDKALAHDLACAWYKAQGKDDWANFHFESSQKLYTEWGATSKVETEHIYYN